MSFFNKKEEVISIELTPYGKSLLAKGEFKPEYYEFYDDDILYDSEYGGQNEQQNEIQQRIKDCSRLKPFYSFEGADKRMKLFKKRKEEGEDDNPVLEKRKNLSMYSLPLATMSDKKDLYPAVTMRILNGEIETTQLTGSNTGLSYAKQFNLKNKEYLIEIRETQGIDEDINYELENPEQLITRSPSTAEKIQTQANSLPVDVIKKEDYILIDISEIETELRNDNFEISMYQLETDPETGEEEELQLYFIPDATNIQNNLLIEEEEIRTQAITKEFANYYFSILRDKEIPNSILCKHLPEEEIERLNAVEGYNINCRRERAIQSLTNPEMIIDEQTLRDLEDC